jgi:predicted nucleic acid-binding protein
MPYLIDTDWVIDALVGRARAVNTIRRLARQRLCVSLITLAEVYEVAFESPNPGAHLGNSQRFFAGMRVIGLSEPIIEGFAEIRSLLRRRGMLIPDFDILIAATALYHDLTLLTFNVNHFQRIPNLRVYRPR